jgi:hypothetical protein
MQIEICDRCFGTPVVQQSVLDMDLCDECLQSLREWRQAPKKELQEKTTDQAGTARLFQNLAEGGTEE